MDDGDKARLARAAPKWEPAEEPPGPESVSAAVVVGGTVAAIGLAALEPVIDLAAGVAGLVGWAAGVGDDDDRPRVAVDVAGTRPPVRVAGGSVACTRCGRAVSWETMSLNQHGYFCSTCGPSQPTAG